MCAARVREVATRAAVAEAAAVFKGRLREQQSRLDRLSSLFDRLELEASPRQPGGVSLTLAVSEDDEDEEDEEEVVRGMGERRATADASPASSFEGLDFSGDFRALDRSCAGQLVGADADAEERVLLDDVSVEGEFAGFLNLSIASAYEELRRAEESGKARVAAERADRERAWSVHAERIRARDATLSADAAHALEEQRRERDARRAAHDRALAAFRERERLRLEAEERERERRAAEEAERRRKAEEEAKRKAEEEKKRRALAAERKQKEQQREARKTPKALSVYREIVKRAEAYNPQGGKLPRKVQLRNPINKLAGTYKSIAALGPKIVRSVELYKGGDPHALAFWHFTVVEALMEKSKDIARNPPRAFAYARLVWLLTTKVEDFLKVFVGALYHHFPHTIPAPPDNAVSAEEEGKYFEKLTGAMMLFSAFTTIEADNHRFNIEYAWKWFARTLNAPPHEHTAVCLVAFLDTAGFDMQRKYGRQFAKAMLVLREHVLPLLHTATPARKAAAAQLRLIERAYWEGANGFPEPKGRTIPRDQDSTE